MIKLHEEEKDSKELENNPLCLVPENMYSNFGSRISLEKEFHSLGATTKEAMFLMLPYLTQTTASNPDDWKVANTTLIFKKGSREEPVNHRTVSLTSILDTLV